MDAAQKDEDFVKCNVCLLVQLNDLYQIDRSSDYLDPGSLILPRISTLVSRLRQIYAPICENGVIFCVPGDFLGPSCLSSEFHGEQMVDILNRIGVDLVSLGNHEFDPTIIEKHHLVARIGESRFKWLNSNFEFHDVDLHDRMIHDERMIPVHIHKISATHLVVFVGLLNADTDETMGVMLDHDAVATQLINDIQADIDVRTGATPDKAVGLTFVAMTHQTLAQDRVFAEKHPEVSLIMGAHDHNVVNGEWVKPTLIVKSASNARTLRLNWIVWAPRFAQGAELPDPTNEPERFKEFRLNVFREAVLIPMKEVLLGAAAPYEQQLDDYTRVQSEFGVEISYRRKGKEGIFIFSVALNTESIEFNRLVPAEVELEKCIRHWNSKCTHSTVAFATAPVAFNVTDQVVRNYSSNFGNLIADILLGRSISFYGKRPLSHIALINSGSFRIDRIIQQGEPMTDRILCDIFGHPNAVRSYRIKGSNLKLILRASLALRNMDPDEGSGEFLQLGGLSVEVVSGEIARIWLVSEFSQKTPLDLASDYVVSTTPYIADRLFPGLIDRANYREWDKDIKNFVRSALSGMDPILFFYSVSDEQRWAFSTAGEGKPP